MLTLNENLQTAQDGDIHHPIVRLLSNKAVADIPFIGNIFTANTTEMKPKYLVHSSGRIIGFNLKYYNSVTNHLYMFYTDADRVEFTIDIPLIINTDIDDFALVELVNGDIGVCYIRKSGSNYDVRAFGVSPAGVTTISDYLVISNTYVKYSIAAIKLADNTYAMVYNNYTSGTPAWNVFTRTSSNFTSWSSAADIISSFGLSPINTIDNRASTFFLLETVAGNELLLFFYFVDGLDTNLNPLRNIYYSKSIDNGATWGTAVKITNYTGFTTIGYSPSAVQTAAESMYLSFTEESGALWMSSSTSGWVGATADSINTLTFDVANRKLYLVLSNFGAGDKVIASILKIDVDSWTIEKSWSASSTPAINNIFYNVALTQYYRYAGNQFGDKVVFGSMEHIGVLNGTTDSITEYHFVANGTYGVEANVTGYPYTSAIENGYIQLDSASDRLYIFNTHLFGVNVRLVVGYIDLNDTGPMFTFNLLFNNAITRPNGNIYCQLFDSQLVVCNDYPNGPGRLTIFDLDGNTIKYYDSTTIGFPYHGLQKAVIVENYLYGIFDYYGGASYVTQKGLCKVDLANDNFTFSIPAYKTADDYAFNHLFYNPEKHEIYITSTYDGLVIFDCSSEFFTRLSATEIPGITGNNTDTFWEMTWDNDSGQFFCGSFYSSWNGLTTFLRDGKFSRIFYKIGTKDTDWSFGDSAILVNGLSESNAWLGIDEDNKVWSFWQKDKLNNTEHYLAWDNIEPFFDITDYVIVDKDIEWKRTVDGKPNELSFSLSHGHLFDSSNQLSLFSPYVKKGRKITLEAGEKVSDVEYFHNQGTFTVTENSIKYSPNEYPEIRVKAEDKRTLWEEDNQISVGYVNEYPENILDDFLTNYVGLSSEEISIPTTMQGSTRIDAQWAEGNVAEIVNTICKRFGYFPKIAVDDVFTLELISDSNSVAHVYSDKSKILEYTPDDKYSSFVNRIIVTGEERDEIEVLFAEERVESLSGTIGWWGGIKHYTVYYSEDQSRRVRYPRLEVISSTRSIAFTLVGKVHEEISEIDINEQYCVVEVDVPDLTPVLAGAIATLVAGMLIGDVVIGGKTQPVGSYICNVAIMTALNVLGSVVNFQYEIHGRPLGYVRRSVEYTENDTEFQVEMGKIISNLMEGFACYTVGDCRFVAEFEMMILKMQRRRVSFNKISHLQDEEGDTIQIPHLYTGFPVKLFISDLKRKWKLGENGYCIDEIEGWRV